MLKHAKPVLKTRRVKPHGRWYYLSERSTWQSALALLNAFAIAARPAFVKAVITFGLAAAGLIDVLFPDAKLRH